MEARLFQWSKDPLEENLESVGKQKAWKAGLITVLKNSPSNDRKFLSFVQVYRKPIDGWCIYEVAETEELEVLPGSSP